VDTLLCVCVCVCVCVCPCMYMYVCMYTGIPLLLSRHDVLAGCVWSYPPSLLEATSQTEVCAICWSHPWSLLSLYISLSLSVSLSSLFYCLFSSLLLLLLLLLLLPSAVSPTLYTHNIHTSVLNVQGHTHTLMLTIMCTHTHTRWCPLCVGVDPAALL